MMSTKLPQGRGPSAGTCGLILTMIASIALSAAGVVYAVECGVAGDGGRGGALAVAGTFLMLFLGRGTPNAALEVEIPQVGVIGEGLPPVEPSPVAPTVPEAKVAQLTTEVAQLTTEVARIRNAVASMLDWQRQEMVYLAIASVVGTVVWGFGDIIAAWCGAALRCNKATLRNKATPRNKCFNG